MILRLPALVAVCLLTAAAGAEDRAAAAQAAIAAADAARVQEAAEADAMAEERVRAEAAIELLETRSAAERRAIAALEAKLAAVDREFTELERQDADRFAWEAPLDEALSTTERRLDSLAQRLPPGVLPAPGEGSDGTAQALLDLRRRLGTALEAAGGWSLAIEEGRLDDEPRAVHLLRCGAAACWWRALEGDGAGTARVVDGELVLSPASDDRTRRAIAAAVAIAGDRAGPQVVDLPLDPEAGP